MFCVDATAQAHLCHRARWRKWLDQWGGLSGSLVPDRVDLEPWLVTKIVWECRRPPTPTPLQRAEPQSLRELSLSSWPTPCHTAVPVCHPLLPPSPGTWIWDITSGR